MDKSFLNCVAVLAAVLGCAFAFAGFAGTASALNYSTSCVVEGAKAKGYVKLLAPDTSTSFSGKAWFYQYDDNGDLIGKDWTTVVAIIIGSDYVDAVDTEHGATTCSFDISEIVGQPSGGSSIHPDRDYVTFCEIKNGKALGSMKLTGSTTSTSFSGKVWFTFLDRDGDELVRDWDTAVVIVVGRDKQEVDTIDAPSGAYSCSLDISEALGR